MDLGDFLLTSISLAQVQVAVVCLESGQLEFQMPADDQKIIHLVECAGALVSSHAGRVLQRPYL